MASDYLNSKQTEAAKKQETKREEKSKKDILDFEVPKSVEKPKAKEVNIMDFL